MSSPRRHSAPPIRSLVTETFRASPLYDLVPYASLTRSERRDLGSFRSPGRGSAILRPVGSNALTLKIADANTVALLTALRRGRRLPGHIRDVYDEQTNVAIARLVLDGVIQLRNGQSYVTAAGAHERVFETSALPSAPDTLAQLSLDALRHAQTLDIPDVLTLSARLYFYNRAPVTPYWRQRLPDRRAIEAMLDLDHHGATRLAVDRDWHRNGAAKSWMTWTRRSRTARASARPLLYKLYVSPSCEAMREAFARTVVVLADTGAGVFKVGMDVNGLLRPDKFVVYFPDHASMRRGIEALVPALRGLPAHGVPFTAAAGASPILSWGVDPPQQDPLPSWRESESWRLWVTNRLALYLLAAKQTGRAALEPWRFALDRLGLDGVDVATWTAHGVP